MFYCWKKVHFAHIQYIVNRYLKCMNFCIPSFINIEITINGSNRPQTLSQYMVKMYLKCMNFYMPSFISIEITINGSDYPQTLTVLRFRGTSIGKFLWWYLRYTFSYTHTHREREVSLRCILRWYLRIHLCGTIPAIHHKNKESGVIICVAHSLYIYLTLVLFFFFAKVAFK